MYSANPIGLAIVQVLTPYIVNSAGDIERMVSSTPLPFSLIIDLLSISFAHTMNPQLWIYAIPAGVTFIVTIIAFWYKEPAIPPAPSGDRDHVPSFWKGLLEVSKFSQSFSLSLSKFVEIFTACM